MQRHVPIHDAMDLAGGSWCIVTHGAEELWCASDAVTIKGALSKIKRCER